MKTYPDNGFNERVDAVFNSKSLGPIHPLELRAAEQLRFWRAIAPASWIRNTIPNRTEFLNGIKTEVNDYPRAHQRRR